MMHPILTTLFQGGLIFFTAVMAAIVLKGALKGGSDD